MAIKFITPITEDVTIAPEEKNTEELLKMFEEAQARIKELEEQMTRLQEAHARLKQEHLFKQ